MLYLESLAASVRLLNAYGRDDQAERLQQTASTLASRLRELHWDPAVEMFADCVVDGRPSPQRSVHVNLLAIEAGLAPEAAALLDRTWKRPGVLQIYGTFFRIHLFEVLHRLGRFQAILDDTREFWGSMIDANLRAENGAVTGTLTAPEAIEIVAAESVLLVLT